VAAEEEMVIQEVTQEAEAEELALLTLDGHMHLQLLL
jgi:hypothetical protein